MDIVITNLQKNQSPNEDLCSNFCSLSILFLGITRNQPSTTTSAAYFVIMVLYFKHPQKYWFPKNSFYLGMMPLTAGTIIYNWKKMVVGFFFPGGQYMGESEATQKSCGPQSPKLLFSLCIQPRRKVWVVPSWSWLLVIPLLRAAATCSLPGWLHSPWLGAGATAAQAESGLGLGSYQELRSPKLRGQIFSLFWW